MTRFRNKEPGDIQLGPDAEMVGLSNTRAVYPFIYVGVVMDARDVQRMGRLRVWIPALTGQAGRFDETKWVTAVYASPFAGASDWRRLDGNSERWQDTQQAYGMWAVPPDIGNEVLVAFVHGDPHQAVWFACLWPSFANYSVPGLSRGPTFAPLEESCEEQPPVLEYNRAPPTDDEPVGAGDAYGNPEKARFDPLHEGLWKQGLYGDHLRGNAHMSARRETPSNVFGFTTPRGHHIVFDDGLPELDEEGMPVMDGTQRLVREGSAEYIRLRTRSGTQVLISDTDGFVYIVTREGNSWVEISDDGIYTYTLGDYNLRVQGDMNVRVDGDYRLEVVGSRTERTVGRWKMHGEDRIEIVSMRVSDCAGEPGILITSEEDIMIAAGRDHVVTAGNRSDRSAGERIADVAPEIHHNDVDVAKAVEAEPTEPERRDDRKLSPEECYPTEDILCDSILDREVLVTHEPFEHPRTTVLDPEDPEEIDQEPDEPEPVVEELIEDCATWAWMIEKMPSLYPVGRGVVLVNGQLHNADVRPLSEFAGDEAVVDLAARRITASTDFIDEPVRDNDGRWRVGWGTRVGEETVNLWRQAGPVERKYIARVWLREDLHRTLAAIPGDSDTLVTRGQVAAVLAVGYHRGTNDRIFRRMVEDLVSGDYPGIATAVVCFGAAGGTDAILETGRPAAGDDGTPPETPTPDSASCPYDAAPPDDADIRAAIDQAVAVFGDADRQYMYAAAWIESRFDPKATTSLSSARGLFQITQRTFDATVRKFPEQLSENGQPYRYETHWNDPRANAKVAAALAADNARSLRRALGRDPTGSEMYMAHLLGTTDAVKLIKASADADPRTLFGRRSRTIVDNNPLIFRKGQRNGRVLTAGEVRKWVATLVETCGAQVTPS